MEKLLLHFQIVVFIEVFGDEVVYLDLYFVVVQMGIILAQSKSIFALHFFVLVLFETTFVIWIMFHHSL